jgi:glutaredoxin
MAGAGFGANAIGRDNNWPRNELAVMKKSVPWIGVNLIIWSCFFFLFSSLAWPKATNAADSRVDIHLFWAQGCPHCHLEKEFLAKLTAKYPQVRLHTYEITSSSENQELLQQVAQRLKVNVSGVPFTVIGDQHFIGWLDEQTSGTGLESTVKKYLAAPPVDLVSGLAAPPAGTATPDAKTIPETITLPLFGEINTRDVSLPLFTIMMGAVDGFNPCAMWVLVFLIGLLLGLEDRWRMWVLGGVFIATSAGIYFLFMTAWLNLLLFLGFIFWVRLSVGIVALVAGYYNLKEYFSNQAGVCQVTNSEKRQRVFQKMKDVTQQQKFWLALGGIIMLAFVVNLVELICSASLPVVYLQVLTMNNLPAWQYYLYILLYIFIFMLDDLIVYIVAMTTLQVSGMTGKYSRLSHLLGGLAMVIIGLLVIMKPEWLMFG